VKTEQAALLQKVVLPAALSLLRNCDVVTLSEAKGLESPRFFAYAQNDNELMATYRNRDYFAFAGSEYLSGTNSVAMPVL
jgi:hypothetical protein